MLTVKHIEKGGHESIRVARNVGFFSAAKDHDGKAHVIAYGVENDGGAANDGYCTYGNGKVFVMNAAGATVANYDLD